MTDLIEKAKKFAIDAHASIDHRRKFTNEPYHVHLERVANILAEVNADAEIIAAAWLHDVLEDVAPKNPTINTEVIREAFGERVLKLVLEVTDVSKPQDGNREARKEIDRKHLMTASDDGKTIKLADLIDNMIDIHQNDPNFAIVFKREALRTLPILQSGNKQLYQRLQQILIELN